MRHDLPRGTVTFLFTDIEGSTRLLRELGDEYVNELAVHRRSLREAFSAHAGVEVDTQGDAFFVAFARASDAVEAARAAQDALAGGRVRVRMGLHTGEPMVTDDGYVGIDVHRAARIAGVAHGGQVLLSRSTRDLVNAAVIELGFHRLKDLGAPELLFQLDGPEFPPLKSLHRTNLPVQPNALVGRDRELAELTKMFDTGSRLVTLSGPGGSGKTRLALQAGAELAEAFTDGVWFVPLAAIDEAALVEPAIAQVVDARGPLVTELQDKRLLLLLDNFEQVLSAAGVVAALLAAAPEVRVIVTSRERLAISAESEFVVPMLSEDAAVALFLERAHALRPDVEPDEHVVEIVRRLDGLPLAVELAAARVKVLTTQQIRERLGHDLDLLTGGSRDAPERQRTLRATIEWSIALLDPSERASFAQLGIFPAGFDLPAAERVADVSLDDLASLVDKSLLRRTDAGRFFMFGTIRTYAAERFEQLPDAAHRLERYAQFFLELAERAAAELTGENQADALDLLEQNQANLRSALAWSFSADAPDLGLELAGALTTFWSMHGHLDEGRRWLADALTCSAAHDARRAKALFGAALLATLQGDWEEARRLSDESRALSAEIGDTALLARSLLTRGRAALGLGDADGARALFVEGAAAAREIGATSTLAMAQLNLGYAALSRGDFGEAEIEATAALAGFESIDDAYGTARSLAALGSRALHLGQLPEAVARLQRSVTLSSTVGDKDGLAWSLELLGAAASRAEPNAAAVFLGAADRLRKRLGIVLEGLELTLHERTVETLDALLGGPAFASVFAGGGEQPIEVVIEQAQLLGRQEADVH